MRQAGKVDQPRLVHLRVQLGSGHATLCGVHYATPTLTLGWADWVRRRAVDARCPTCEARAPSEGEAVEEVLRRRWPLIFLDIDGVLVNIPSMTGKHGPRIQPLDGSGASWRPADPGCAMALRWIVRRTRAQVVLSSSWRKDHVDPWILQVFRSWDLGVAEPVSVTPSLRDQPRGVEIATWRSEHLHRGPFVIIDDDDDMGDLRKHLVQTTVEAGLTMDLAEQAVDILSPG